MEQNRNQGYQNQYQRPRMSTEAMLRKFFRDVQQSGILSEVKRRRFREKDLSRTKKRQIARRKSTRKKILRGY